MAENNNPPKPTQPVGAPPASQPTPVQQTQPGQNTADTRDISTAPGVPNTQQAAPALRTQAPPPQDAATRNALAQQQPGEVKQQTASGEQVADESNAEQIRQQREEQLRQTQQGSQDQALEPLPIQTDPEQIAWGGSVGQGLPGTPATAGAAADPRLFQAGAAPAVARATTRQRIDAIDQQLRTAEEDAVARFSTDRELLRAQKRELERMEAQTVIGAPLLAPRSRLFDVSEAQESSPDYHFRWLRIMGDDARVSARQANGYERVPAAEGGRQLGNEYALFRIPKRRHQLQQASQRARDEQRYNIPRQEFEQIVEGVARELRDKHGIKINSDRVLNND